MQTIDNLASKFQDIVELQKYCDSQYQTILRLQAEVEHLKQLLSSSKLVDEPTPIIVTDEQAICEMEIQRLKATAFERGLTLEETKRLDLLVKNLFLSKEQKKDIPASFRSLSGISRDALIQIASQPEPEDV